MSIRKRYPGPFVDRVAFLQHTTDLVGGIRVDSSHDTQSRRSPRSGLSFDNDLDVPPERQQQTHEPVN